MASEHGEEPDGLGEEAPPQSLGFCHHAPEALEMPVGEQFNLLEYLYKNCFPALQSYARTRGEVVRLIKTVQIVPPPPRRFTCQVVMGERHFPIMSADSRQEAREQAVQATMVLLLGEEERQMREEERQMREEERQMREEERQMREEERLSSQPSSSRSSSLQTLVRTEVKERLSPQPSSSSSSLHTLVKTEVKEKRLSPQPSSSSSISSQMRIKTEVKEERLSLQPSNSSSVSSQMRIKTEVKEERLSLQPSSSSSVSSQMLKTEMKAEDTK